MRNQSLFILIFLISSVSAQATPDDLCPRLEGIDLQCTPVAPPGGGGGALSPKGCTFSYCMPGYNCSGEGGGGGGIGNGSGDGGGSGIDGEVNCDAQPTTCYYVKDGSMQQIQKIIQSTVKVVSTTCEKTQPSPELPPVFNLKPVTKGCKNEIPQQCLLLADTKQKTGDYYLPCKGQKECPDEPGYTKVASIITCTDQGKSDLPLCDSLTVTPPPACP